MRHQVATIVAFVITIGWFDDIGFAAQRPPGARADDHDLVHVTVDVHKPLHAISPLIYGASSVEPARAALGVSAVRWGGNRSSRYNWKTQADNAGADWFFLNGKAGRWSDFVPGTTTPAWRAI